MRTLVTGAAGFIGQQLVRSLPGDVVGCARAARPAQLPGVPWVEADLERPGEVTAALTSMHPDVVVHAGAMARLGACESDPGMAARVNVDATGEIAAWCDRAGARLLFCSTDQVFDGAGSWYAETDQCDPINVYGTTKERAESLVRGICPDSVVLRLALVYGKGHAGLSASDQLLNAVERKERITLYSNEFRTPVGVSCVCSVIGFLMSMESAPACLHVGGPDRLSRVEFAEQIAARAGIGTDLFEPADYAPVPGQARRPADVSLNCERLRSLGLPVPVAIGGAGLI